MTIKARGGYFPASATKDWDSEHFLQLIIHPFIALPTIDKLNQFPQLFLVVLSYGILINYLLNYISHNQLN